MSKSLKFALKQLILLVFALLLLSAAVLPLFETLRNQESGPSSANTPEVGEIVIAQNTVRKRPSSALSWYVVNKGNKVHLFDSLVTGEDSRALVKLKDGTKISLRPNTLMSFLDKRENGELEFEIDQGQIDIRTPKKLKRNFHIASQTLKLEPNTTLTLKKDSYYEQEEIEVSTGKAALQGQQTESLTIKKGEAHSKTNADTPVTTQALHIPIIQPLDGSVLQTHHKTETIHFRWFSDKATHIEFSGRRDFIGSQKKRVRGRDFRKAFGYGTFYWRLRKGKRTSQFYTFKIKKAAEQRHVAIERKVIARENEERRQKFLAEKRRLEAEKRARAEALMNRQRAKFNQNPSITKAKTPSRPETLEHLPLKKPILPPSQGQQKPKGLTVQVLLRTQSICTAIAGR